MRLGGLVRGTEPLTSSMPRKRTTAVVVGADTTSSDSGLHPRTRSSGFVSCKAQVHREWQYHRQNLHRPTYSGWNARVKGTIAIASDFAEANVHADAPRQVTHRPAAGVALGLGETWTEMPVKARHPRASRKASKI